MKRILLAVVLLIIPILPVWSQGQGSAKHTIATNMTADTTNKVFYVPYIFNWISFQSDGPSNVWVTPDALAITNYASTNFYFPTGQSNKTILVTNVLDNTLAAHKGTCLAANGGAVMWDANAVPRIASSTNGMPFQAIALTVGNNICIEIGIVSLP